MKDFNCSLMDNAYIEWITVVFIRPVCEVLSGSSVVRLLEKYILTFWHRVINTAYEIKGRSFIGLPYEMANNLINMSYQDNVSLMLV